MKKGKAGIKNATLLIAHVLVGEVGNDVIMGMTQDGSFRRACRSGGEDNGDGIVEMDIRSRAFRGSAIKVVKLLDVKLRTKPCFLFISLGNDNDRLNLFDLFLNKDDTIN